MLENSATITRSMIETMLTSLPEDDEVYGALAACIRSLNAIAWNRFAHYHQAADRARIADKRRRAFTARHKRQ